jgi:hypothetical protein
MTQRVLNVSGKLIESKSKREIVCRFLSLASSESQMGAQLENDSPTTDLDPRRYESGTKARIARSTYR